MVVDMVRDVIFRKDMRWEDSLSWTIPELISWANEMLGEIPEEFLSSARFEIEYDRGAYDEGDNCEVRIFFDRPKTGEEIAKEKRRTEQYERQRRAEKKRLYESLRKEFG